MRKPNLYDVVYYITSTRKKPFHSYEEAEAACIKHLEREENRSYDDRPWEMYWELLRSKGIRVKHPSVYDFGEVKHFLKKRHLWGTQTFGTRGSMDHPDYVGDVGDVSIYYEGNYDYVEIFGLSEYHLNIVRNAER